MNAFFSDNTPHSARSAQTTSPRRRYRPDSLALLRLALFAGWFFCLGGITGLVQAATAPAAAAPASSSPAMPGSAIDALSKVLKVDPNSNSLAAKLFHPEQDKPKTRIDTSNNEPSRGVIGLLSTMVNSMQSRYVQVAGPWRYWQQRFVLAAGDISDIANQPDESLPMVGLNFIEMIGVFGAVVLLIASAGKLIRKKLQLSPTLHPDPTLKELLIYAFRRILPGTVGLIVEIAVAVSLEPSLGRTLATVLLYALIGAIVLHAVCTIIFSMSHGGHRNVAIAILNKRARGILIGLGFAGWLGDALNNPKVYDIVGQHICLLVAVLANMAAAILCACFALRYRRPVAHLIRNRSWPTRKEHRARIETLNVIAAIWYIPMLLLATGVTVATLFALNNSNTALDHAIGSAAALVGMFFAGTILLRIRNKNLSNPRRSPYLRRLTAGLFSLMQIAVWIAFFEILSIIWGTSLFTWLKSSALGNTILDAVQHAALTLVVAWVVWCIIDTSIHEAIYPSRPLRRGRRIASNRMRTILPLIRNTFAVLLLLITAITVLGNLGINVTPLLASAGVVGVAIGFGSQSLVKDLITGVFILIEDSIAIGEWVDVGSGHAGTVEHISVRTVRLRDGAGAVHTIPFSQIVAIRNDSREYAVATINLQVTLDSNIDSAMRMMRETSNEMLEDAHFSRLLQKPLDIWGLDAFNLNGATILGGFRTRPQTQSEIIRAFNLRIKTRIEASDDVSLASRWGGLPQPATTEPASGLAIADELTEPPKPAGKV